MRLNWRTLWHGIALLGVFWMISGAEPVSKHYVPVVPASGIHAALRSNLETVRAWLNDKDFASANQAALGLNALAHLYFHQGSAAAWREKATALQGVCSRLTSATRGKDEAECGKLVQECTRLLDDLVKLPPGSPEEKGFKPQGSTKTWMLLLDGAYSDAKTAKTPQEMEQLAQAIAEEVNAYQYFRTEARWRQSCLEVRSAALAVAEKARTRDLAGARAGLKSIYQGCEACHERSRK